jgi:hypothetical protein
MRTEVSEPYFPVSDINNNMQTRGPGHVDSDTAFKHQTCSIINILDWAHGNNQLKYNTKHCQFIFNMDRLFVIEKNIDPKLGTLQEIVYFT